MPWLRLRRSSGTGSAVHWRMSPGWRSGTRQIESRVVSRMARARPSFRTATFAGALPTALAESPRALGTTSTTDTLDAALCEAVARRDRSTCRGVHAGRFQGHAPRA
jgi:hypothetical protein